MNDPKLVSIERVIRLHGRVIQEFGGTAELRDRGLLESALALPGAQFGGEYLHKTIPEMAAAYLFHLCKNHPFVDGNKRIALTTSEMFLIMNGWKLNATNQELEEVTLKVASSAMEKAELTQFFASHSERQK